MKTPIVIIAIMLVMLPARLRASFEGAAHGVRSRAMGRAFVSLGDDASTLFINPAGLVTAGTILLYGDYAEPPQEHISSSAKGCVVAPAWGFVAGAGWHRIGRTDGNTENLFTAGIARSLLRGTQGSFLSAGANISIGRILTDPVCGMCGGKLSESAVTGDAGVMLRPLPIVSLGYSVSNLRDAGFDRDESDWTRVHRWGVSYFWEGRVILSFGQQHAGGDVERQYGFSVRTALPVELMGGFSGGNASGGIRLLIDRFRAAAAFSSSERYGTEIWVSLEVFIGRSVREDTP